jgi:microcystin-dependent protein
MDDTDLTFTITGSFANYPTGSSGPFAMSVDDGLTQVEKVLCSALDIATGIATVWSDTSGSNGRGYDGTPANAHTPLAPPAPQVRPCWTAAEAAEANMAVAYLLGSLGGAQGTTGEILTWNSGGYPQWQAAGSPSNLMPIGGISLWGAAAAPTNWHLCDGSAISRTTYSTLFSIYGVTWGAGDGLTGTTFNVPDLRNKFPLGAGGILGMGASGGSQTVPLPSHTHTIADQQHYHQQADTGFPGDQFIVGSSGHSTLFTNSGADADHSPAWNLSASSTTTNSLSNINGTAAAGGSATYLPPAAGVNFIIRVL